MTVFETPLISASMGLVSENMGNKGVIWPTVLLNGNKGENNEKTGNETKNKKREKKS